MAFNIFVGLILFIYVFHFFIAEETLRFSWDEVSLGIDPTPAQLRTPLEIYILSTSCASPLITRLTQFECTGFDI